MGISAKARQLYRFLYPAINFACLPSKLEERRILVKSVRDTELQPLDEETLDSRPFTKRGRWLLTGLDLDKFEERSFYVESMVAVVQITVAIKKWRDRAWDESERFSE